MKILSTNVYVGPNLYANFPVIRHIIDIGILEGWPSVKLGEGFINGLIEALPGIKKHGCSYGTEGGFVKRLREDEGTWIGHIWEHVTLEIQTVAGSDTSFGRTRSEGKPGIYRMVFEYHQREVGLEAALLARRLLISLLPEHIQNQLEVKIDDDFDFQEQLVRFIKFAQSKEFGPSTGALVKAATKRGIPYMRLNEGSLVQFGHGKYQKRIQATVTSQTSQIAVDIACDKEETNNILDSLGLPVPKQRVARSETYTLRVARKLGYPLVIKPLEGNHGRGITTDIKTEQEALDAFRVAKSHSREIIVEQYITGFDHRMVVVNGELVAVAKRVPGHVIGDGKHTIKELIDIVNSDPRRGVGHEKVLTRLELDRQAYSAMQHKGYNENTVLDKNETLYLRETANLSTGGTAIDVTDLVHPDNKDMAVRAVLGIGLDVGGVDFLTDDISKSYKDVGGGICEVNAAPGFRMHVAPSEGEPRDVAGSVIDSLFPEENDNARIPICSITGTNGKTTTSRMLSHIYKSCGYHVGLTTTDGIYIDGRLAVSGDTTGPKSAQVVLKDPTVDIAVMETARGGLVRNGMGYDYCDVGAVLNVESDHLGLKGIDTLEQLARVKRIVTDAARDTAVFNADDPKTLKMAPHTDAKHIFYVTMNPQHMLVREHIRSGGKAAIIEKGINGDMITIFDNHRHIPVLWTHLIPATMEGKAIHNVQNAMFSIAIAYSVGVKLDDIRNGMRTFSTSFFQAPGRMNIFEEHPFKVLMDYAHNPSAVSMIAKLVSQLEIKGRRICVLSSPGDRRDEDVVEMAKAAAGYFDYYICREDDNRRGRSVGEISHIQAETLKEAGVSSEYIERINDEFEAVQGALEIAEAGDYVCIFADNIKRTWKQIIYYNGEDKQQEKTIEPKPQHISVADMSQDDSVSEEISELLQGNIISDERGVRVSFQEDEDSD